MEKRGIQPEKTIKIFLISENIIQKSTSKNAEGLYGVVLAFSAEEVFRRFGCDFKRISLNQWKIIFKDELFTDIPGTFGKKNMKEFLCEGLHLAISKSDNGKELYMQEIPLIF